MARELDSEMLRRLQTQYGEMSDGELLGLAAVPEDLTELAAEVLRGEMTRRGLKLEAQGEAAGGMDGLARPEFGTKLPDGRVVLMTFHDAIAAGVACDRLEAEGIEVDVRDVSPVALEVIVRVDDRKRAVEILRAKMGLFPLQEVEEADEVVDDGTVTALGYFGRRGDAEDVARALEEAGVWHRIVANGGGTVEDEDAFRLEVREVDLAEAGEVVEASLGLGE